MMEIVPITALWLGGTSSRLDRCADRHIGSKDTWAAGLLHLRDHHRPDRRGVGDRRTRDAAQECRRQHVDREQPAAYAHHPDKHIGESYEAPVSLARYPFRRYLSGYLTRADKPSALRPVEPTRKLFHEIAERIAAEIIRAKLAPGARLPTEQQMAATMGVSRAVVREAVAALRADGDPAGCGRFRRD